jgi:hypothetical protein
MKPDANSAEIETRLRAVRPAGPSEALRQKALARARAAWREAPAPRLDWSMLRPWLAAAAVLALGLFVNGLLVPAQDTRTGVTAVARPGPVGTLGNPPWALAEGQCLTVPTPGHDLDLWLRQRDTDLRDLLCPEPPGGAPPPATPPSPQSNGRGPVTEGIASVTRVRVRAV